MKLKVFHSINQIYKDWERIYNLMENPSPFFNPSAFKISYKYFYPYYVRYRCYPEFITYIQSGKIRAIFPLLKYSNGKRQIFGFPNGFNECDFIYESKDILTESLLKLKNEIGMVEMMKINSRSPIIFHSNSEKRTDTNVEIKFDDSFEDYFSTLSSSVRQNIRTAYNRVKSDDYSIDFQIFSQQEGEGRIMPLNNIINMYCKRHEVRYGLSTSILKKWFLKNQSFATKMYLNADNALTFYLEINNQPAAFMSGLFNNSRYIVPRLSINDQFKRYSPGVILICETIKYLISNTSIRTLDLSKGEEKYKYNMGGTQHLTYNFNL